MDESQREVAILGSFDSVVSITGFVFGLLLHGSPESAIAIGGLGGAIAAAVSMGVGEYEMHDGPWRPSLHIAIIMFLASVTGSLVAIWPYFVFGKSVAILVAGIGCLAVASWIGYQKHKGIIGYVIAYATLL